MAVYKFASSLVIYIVTLTLDPVSILSAIMTAITSLISSISREAEIFLVLIPLIVLVDVIGLVLAISAIIGAMAGDYTPYLGFYMVALVWDIEAFRISRQIS